MTRSALRLPGLHKRHREGVRPVVGERAGIETIPGIDQPPAPGEIRIQCIDYGPEMVRTTRFDTVDALLASAKPPDATVRWINVDGLHPYVVEKLRQQFGYHTLAAEDVVHVPQRPRVEVYDNHLLVIARMLMMEQDHLVAEQVSMFLFEGTLITFQEQVAGDVWEPIRRRLERGDSRHRANDASYLLYALLDAVVDHCFPILEHYGDLIEEAEDAIVENPTPRLLQRMHDIKRDLVLLRRVMWPTREVAGSLNRNEHGKMGGFAANYMRDVYEHTIQIVDIIETYRDMTGGLTDLYLSSVSHRMNEVMKVLTVIATIFIPITFLAGVYGMNFHVLPELKWKYGYAAFWGICVAVVAGMLVYFRRRDWLGRGDP